MAKDKDYEALLNSYNMVVAQAKELREQMAAKNQMWSEYEAKCDVIEKHARKLCEMILAKDRSEMVLGNAKTWHAFTTDELLQKAMESFVLYNKDRSDLMNRIMQVAEDRGRQLESLKEQISQMLQHGNISTVSDADEMIRQAEKEAAEKAALEKASSQNKKAAAEGRVELIIEEAGDVDDEGELQAISDLINTAEQVKLTPNSIPQARCKKKNELVKKAEESVVMTHIVDLKDNIEQCGDMEWQIFEVIGKKGLSRYKEIEAELTQDRTTLKNAVRVSAMKLLSMGALHKDTFTLPISAKSVFYRLSDIGQRMYRHRFNEEPCISEIERIIAEHDNAEHGYGIMDISKMLEECGRYTDISTYNRDKAITVTVNGQKLKYIPDLICKSKKGYTEYIEYERGTHHQVDFNMKINKMCKVTKFLNFIVPNRKVMKDLKGKVDVWLKTQDPNALKGYTLRIGTAYNVKDESGYPVEYHFSKGMEAVKNPF